MKKIFPLVEDFAKECGFEESLMLGKIQCLWEELFPPPICLYAKPVFYKNGTLLVNVSSNLWLTELHYQSAKMTAKLQKRFYLKQIKFKAGEVLQNNTIYNKKPTNTCINPVQSAQFVEETKAFIARISNTVEDNDLKQALIKAMERTLLYEYTNTIK
ncbi:MAG: DUF721 domain-containing protein [Candidatus Magnetoovum sp. WYHC-5]|nr:DUF721 domain-containing protein [Candidatus Magnetoovum sp. WYHC-5]